jgi:hypothetical protein
MIVETTPADCAAEDRPPTPIGLARLAKMAFDGMDLGPLCDGLSARAVAVPPDAAALMDLSTIAMLKERRDDRLALQARALTLHRLYRQPAAGADGLRLLAFMAPGDFLANTPVEFMLQDLAAASPQCARPGSPSHPRRSLGAAPLGAGRGLPDERPHQP